MIIVGYPGIGKTTTANNDHEHEYIDLDSSLFRTGSRDAMDVEIYCKVAVSLNDRGFKVFVSSHEFVIRYLLENYPNRDIVVCLPDAKLKTAWIRRLRDRYMADESEKNKRALMHVLDNFDRDIERVNNYGFPSLAIDRLDYNLRDLLEEWEAYRHDQT